MGKYNKKVAVELCQELITKLCFIYRKRKNKVRKIALRKKIIKVYALYLEAKKANERQFWVRPIFTVTNRLLQGASANLSHTMRDSDPEKYLRLCLQTIRI